MHGLMAAVVGVAALLDGEARLGPATCLGVVLGLLGGTILTLVIAFRMGGAPGRHVGLEPASAPRLPLTGWSLAVGDRRVPHFFATHMMQALPLAGLAKRRTICSSARVTHDAAATPLSRATSQAIFLEFTSARVSRSTVSPIVAFVGRAAMVAAQMAFASDVVSWPAQASPAARSARAIAA